MMRGALVLGLVLAGCAPAWTAPAPAVVVADGAPGEPVYSPDECIGPVIMGRCHGALQPRGGYRERCYGTMLGGTCTGPQF